MQRHEAQKNMEAEMEQQAYLCTKHTRSQSQGLCVELGKDSVGRITRFKNVTGLDQLKDMDLLSPNQHELALLFYEARDRLSGRPAPMPLELSGREATPIDDNPMLDVYRARVRRYFDICSDNSERDALIWSDDLGRTDRQLQISLAVKAKARLLALVLAKVEKSK